jgi:hypothetical protein
MENGLCIKSVFVFWFDGDKQSAIRAGHVKFGLKIINLYTNSVWSIVLSVNNYKYDNDADFWG